MTTNRKFRPGRVDLETWFDQDTPKYVRNRMLLDWLADWRAEPLADARSLPAQRDRLFDALRHHGGLHGVLTFPSRAIYHRSDYEPEGSPLRDEPTEGHQDVSLLMRAEDIEHALCHGEAFGNEPYDKLGSGTFLLGLDGDASRRRQREAAKAALRHGETTVLQLAELAVDEASPISLRAPVFDLAELAEQAALRFCSRLFGFATADHPLLEAAMRDAYLALTHQILGRHFVTDPVPIVTARGAMGLLLARACALIDEYQRDPTDDPANLPTGVDLATDIVPGFDPAMRRLARQAGDLSGEELGVLVVGVMAGVVGNVQAAVCSALHEFFRNKLVEPLRDLVGEPGQSPPYDLWPWIAEALRLNPPAAYLPRRLLADVTLPGGAKLAKGSQCVLAIVAALRAKGTAFQGGFDAHGKLTSAPPAEADPLIFGLPAGGPKHGLHACIGDRLAVPLITAIVRRVLRLRGLAETCDPEDGRLAGLERRWGFTCTRYPLSCRLDRQHALNVSMRVKAPVAVHAEMLRTVIRVGAPRIEWALRNSRHIHFAWFELIENDTRLVLHTVYDGLFDSYIEHFALAVGELFDQIFAHIEDAPPMPVSKFPGAFLELIRRSDRPVVGGYFFSAYPSLEAAAITRTLGGTP